MGWGGWGMRWGGLSGKMRGEVSGGARRSLNLERKILALWITLDYFGILWNTLEFSGNFQGMFIANYLSLTKINNFLFHWQLAK